MFTEDELTAGAARLDSPGKLKAADLGKLVPIMRMFLGSLETQYGYDLAGKLAELDDSLDGYGRAAQVAACVIALEDAGFGTAELTGAKDGLKLRLLDDYGEFLLIALSQIYPIPEELSRWDLRRRQSRVPKTGTIRTRRGECW